MLPILRGAMLLPTRVADYDDPAKTIATAGEDDPKRQVARKLFAMPGVVPPSKGK
jgi:hypothetical protein